MNTKFAIGCLIQWFECDMIEDYIDSLKDAINQYKGEILVDFMVCLNQDLEKCISEEQLKICESKIGNQILDVRFKTKFTRDLITIADYRREFNQKYCTQADVLVWGESDMLVPKQMFNVLDYLHQNVPVSKYLATFGINKMWDNSWKPLEHIDFTDKPFIEGDDKNWWSIPYTMGIEEMNSFNDKIEELQVTQIQPHKFNGCGLVISSEVIKAGANIPKGMFFVHEDTSFMFMTNKLLGNIPQYVIRNILLVHNRKHHSKRYKVKGEAGIDPTNTGLLREQHDWYNKAYNASSENLANLFNPNYKFKTWKDVL